MNSHTVIRIGLAMLAALTAPVAAPLRHHPHDVIDCLELSPTFSTDHTVFATSDGSLNLVARSVNGGFTWRDVRSGLTGKHVYAMVLAEDFAASGRAYVAMGNDGVGWTRDQGTTWQMGLKNRDVRVLVALPFVGDAAPTLFFATQDGLFRCGDPARGDVELDTTRFKGHRTNHVAAARASATNVAVFAATDDGRIHRSDDGGASWTTLSQKGAVTRIVLSPKYAEDGTLWLATFGDGLLVSRDRGATFTARNDGLDDRFVNDLAVPRRWPQCPDLFAATRDKGVFRSKDGGDHWELTSLRVEKTDQTTNHHKFVRIPADYPDVPMVYCGTFEGVHLSLDGGDHWMKSNLNPTRFGRRVVVSPDFAKDRTVFTSGYGMLLATSGDAGDTWNFGAIGVHALSSYGLAVAPTWKDDGLVILGVFEAIWRSGDHGATWKKIALPPIKRGEGTKAYDATVQQIAFSPDFAKDRICCAVNSGGLFISNDAALSFRVVPPPVEYPVDVAFSPDFTRDHVVFVGGGGIRRSTDGGETWSGELAPYPVTGIACAPDWTTTGEAYAWSPYYGFAKSSDRGVHWKLMNDGLEGHRPVGVRLAPGFASNGTMYMTTFGGGLFRSTDRGNSWKRFGSRDPRLDHCNSIALSPAFETDHILFVGTFEGIWRSSDGGANFTLTTKQELYDQERQPWLRTGTWYRRTRAGAYGGSIDNALHAGDAYTLPFVGNSIRLHGTRGPDHGKADVVLDRKVVATIDAYAAQRADSAVLFESDVPWGYHVVTLRVRGEKCEASTGTEVGIDAAVAGCVGPENDVPIFSHD